MRTYSKIFTVALTVLILSCGILFTQNSNAYLLEAPVRVEGIDFLPQSYIPAFTGFYKLGNEMIDEKTGGRLHELMDIEITYSRYNISILDTWTAVTCGKFRLYRIPEAIFPSYFHSGGTSLSLFFSFKTEDIRRI